MKSVYALLSAALVSVMASPALGQSYGLPEIGLETSGTCRDLAIANPTSSAMASLGCLNVASNSVAWKGNGSSLTVTPSASAPAGTLARILASGTSLSNPVFSGIATNTSPAGCLDNLAGRWTGDNTATWIPDCYGTWFSNDPDNLRLHLTRGTTSSNGAYPPQPSPGTPTQNQGTNHLIQTKADGGKPIQTSGAIINLDVVGGSYSQAHPSDAQSPNATGMLISSHQRPGPNGEAPPATWSLNLDHVISPNVGSTQTYGVELDLSNFNRDCGLDTGCISAWYFYGGINAYPNLAFHYFGNPHTGTYTGTATSSGNTFTAVTGQFNPNITTLSYAGTTWRVDCTTTTCTADGPVGNNSTPGEFAGKNAMAHYGLMFQDGAAGTQVQDADIFTNDAARHVIHAAGKHRIGLDFTADAMPYAALFRAGQNVCYNGAAACMSFSTALNSWLFQSGPEQGSFGARIDTNGSGYFNVLTTAGATITSVATVGSAGSTQETATPLHSSSSDVVVATAGPGVRINGTIGYRQEIFNNSGTEIQVYPGPGQQIGAAGTNVPVTMASGAHATFICFSGTQCRQAP